MILFSCMLCHCRILRLTSPGILVLLQPGFQLLHSLPTEQVVSSLSFRRCHFIGVQFAASHFIAGTLSRLPFRRWTLRRQPFSRWDTSLLEHDGRGRIRQSTKTTQRTIQTSTMAGEEHEDDATDFANRTSALYTHSLLALYMYEY